MLDELTLAVIFEALAGRPHVEREDRVQADRDEEAGSLKMMSPAMIG